MRQNRTHCRSAIAGSWRTSIVAIAALLVWLASSFPAFAQTSEKEPIVLDGREIFQVSQSGPFTARERAADANGTLWKLVNSPSPPTQVEIDLSGDLPILRLDGQHLLTITQADTPQGRSRTEQAIAWANELEPALAQARQERSLPYVLRAILLSLLAAAIAFGIGWGVGHIWHRWIQPRWHREDANKTPIPDPANPPSSFHALQGEELGAQAALTLIRALAWLVALTYAIDQFPQTRHLSRSAIDLVVTSLTAKLLPLGDNAYSALDVLVLIGMFATLAAIAKTAKRILQMRVLSITGLSRSAQETIALIANYGFIFVGAIVVLQLWGLDISSLTVFAGVLGVGIGLGLQGIAKEFVSGLVLIFERPIQVGDFVEVDDLVGTVEHISVRSTEISTIDRISVILPNSRFLEAEVINWSHRNPISRLRLPVGVAYGSDLATVREVLLEAANAHADVLSVPAPNVLFLEFGDSALKFNLLVWIKDPRKQFQLKSDLYFRIDALFRDRGVVVPFPQRDLHVHSNDPVGGMSPQLADSLAHLSESLASWLHHQQLPGKE